MSRTEATLARIFSTWRENRLGMEKVSSSSRISWIFRDECLLHRIWLKFQKIIWDLIILISRILTGEVLELVLILRGRRLVFRTLTGECHILSPYSSYFEE